MKRREMVREKDNDRDADDFQASVDKQGCLGLQGPVVRTLLLVLNYGKTGGVVSSTLQAECVEGLLSYARLLFAQPQAGKLSVLVAAGRQVQTVTSWDPGEQSVDAIVKGFREKATGDGGCNIKQAIQESLGALFQTSSTNGLAMGIDNKATSVAPKLRKLVTMVRTRLVVVLPCDRVAGDAVHVYHKLVVEALACISMKEHDVESCHAVFLDFSSMLEPAFEPLVTSTAANKWRVLFCLAVVTTIITLQIEQRNKMANYLDQKITTDLILDSQYTCACTLPQSLLALQKTPIQTVSNSDLQRCYSKDQLSTITVVQFNNDTVYDVAKTVESFNASVNLSYASNEKGWVFLEQKATELVLWSGTDNGTLSSICKGVPYLDTVFTLSLEDPKLPLYFDYPLSYMRMAIEYNCSDCNVCSPDEIMTALNKSKASFLVPIDQWVECSGYGMDTSPRYPCNAAQSYHGRCNLYPTFDISMSSRLTEVIDTLESMNSSLTITTRTPTGQNGIEMHANVLYYNQSKVVETNNVTYGYFQIDPSTDPIWPILVASYPNIVESCLNMETFNVPVCNGTSICNVYKKLENGVSTAALNCIDFSQDYDSCRLMANASGNENISDQLCKRNSPSCQKVLPYQVKYPVPDLAKTLPDTMSVSIIMNNSWLQTYKNGVCSRVYAEVVPYTLASGRSVFLETNCTSQDTCIITGNYNAVSDTPDMQPRPVDGPDRKDLESSLTPNYVCYKVTKVPWSIFLITLFGTIGGIMSGIQSFANNLYKLTYDRWHEWHLRQSGSGRVDDTADTDDPTNSGDQVNAGAPPRAAATPS